MRHIHQHPFNRQRVTLHVGFTGTSKTCFIAGALYCWFVQALVGYVRTMLSHSLIHVPNHCFARCCQSVDCSPTAEIKGSHAIQLDKQSRRTCCVSRSVGLGSCYGCLDALYEPMYVLQGYHSPLRLSHQQHKTGACCNQAQCLDSQLILAI